MIKERAAFPLIVDAKSPGITLGKRDKKMGHKGAHTCDVIFENCRVPTANLIGGVEGRRFKTAMKVLDKGRIHIAAVCVAVAKRTLSETLRYATERRQFGQPIAEFQLVQAMLADSKAEIYAPRRRDDGLNVTTEASCAKLFASEMCGHVADRAAQIFGGARLIEPAHGGDHGGTRGGGRVQCTALGTQSAFERRDDRFHPAVAGRGILRRQSGDFRRRQWGDTVRLLAQQYAFTPNCILVPADAPVTLRVSADVVHGFLIQGTNLNGLKGIYTRTLGAVSCPH